MKAVYHMSSIPQSGVKVTLEGSLTRLLFDFTEHQAPTEDDEPAADDLYDCESVDAHGRNKEDIVAAIVNDRYDSNAFQALMANHALAMDPDSGIAEEKRAEYLAEFAAFEAWRTKAKQVATIAVSLING